MDLILNYFKGKFDNVKYLTSITDKDFSDEAISLLTMILNAIASYIWPGENIDRKRFIETCIKYPKVHYGADLISVPILYKNICEPEKNILENKFPFAFSGYEGIPDTMVLCGADIDMYEDDLKDLGILHENIRKYSYANLLYTELRCGFAHKYSMGKQACKYPMAKKSQSVSYVNEIKGRKIHFHYNWMETICSSLIDYFYGIGEIRELNRPKKWWIEGGLID